MNKPSSTPKVCKKETKKVAGMETIKRQMDSLTEMVNDLQVMLVSDWPDFYRFEFSFKWCLRMHLQRIQAAGNLTCHQKQFQQDQVFRQEPQVCLFIF